MGPVAHKPETDEFVRLPMSMMIEESSGTCKIALVKEEDIGCVNNSSLQSFYGRNYQHSQ